MHLCIAGSIRAMPEKEKPPAMPVDIYFCFSNTAEGTAKFPRVRTNGHKNMVKLLCGYHGLRLYDNVSRETY